MLALIVAAALFGVGSPPDARPASSAGRAPLQTDTLTLSAAVARARADSPRRRAAVLVADGAREAVAAAGRLPNPVFELRTENLSPADAASLEADVFAVVTQPLELGGRRTLRRRLAETEREVTQTAIGALERTLALDTVRAYIRALRARALVETLTGIREGLTLLVTSVGRRVDEGYSAEADLLRFKTEAARVDGDIARAQLELERSLAALAVVIGATSPIQPAQLVEPAPLPVPPADPAVIAASVVRHPEVLAASATVARAQQLTALERARGLPDSAVTGGYKRTNGFDTGVLGVLVSVPLFDRNNGSVARSLGIERGAMADREALMHQLSTDTASVIRAAQTIAARADRVQQELLAPAEEVRRSALAAFREGTADVLKLIDAERVYADVRRAAIDLRLDALLTTIEARFALGEETIP